MGTISDKSAYLNTTKTLLREKINDLGQDLDEEDTFRSYVEALEEVWNDYPKVTATDVTEATLEGTKAGKMKLDIKGNSTQETTTGKQLFTPLDYTQITTGANGSATISKTSDTITIDSSASSQASGFYIQKANLPNYVKDYDTSIAYYLSADVIATNNCQFKFGSDANIVDLTANTLTRLIYRVSANSSFLFYVKSLATTVKVSKIMVTLAEDSTYEEFTGRTTIT